MIVKTITRICTAFFVALCFFSLSGISHAYESSSASFEIHAGVVETSSGSSTSASFIQQGAVGQNAIGSSTSATKGILSGVLYWFFSLFTPSYTQVHYRWRYDDGSETTATWQVNQDTQYVNFPSNTAKRLRFEVSNEGWTRGTAPVFTLEFAQLTSGTDCASSTGLFTTPYLAVPTDYSKYMHLATTTQGIGDGSATTNQLSASNASFTAGQMKFTSNTTTAIPITSEQYTEIEYGVLATSIATTATYCFRLTNNGATTNFAYSLYPSLTLTNGVTIKAGMYSAAFDTTGITDGPAYNSILWKGTAGTGKVHFQFATSPNTTGPWTYYGSACIGGAGDWFETTAQDTPIELNCPTQFNNNRYYKYRIELCSNNCTASGVTSPIVTDVIVNWSP